MKNRKVPLRKCVITNERLPKAELIRVVRTKDGEVFVDPTGKQNGRGAYLKRNKTVITKARKTKKLNKHLEADVPEDVYDQLLALVDATE